MCRQDLYDHQIEEGDDATLVQEAIDYQTQRLEYTLGYGVAICTCDRLYKVSLSEYAFRSNKIEPSIKRFKEIILLLSSLLY